MAKTMFAMMEGPANALAINREANQVVVAGRNVFKILVIEDDKFSDGVNLRVGKNINLNYSCADVVWHPVDDNILATAATNGAVVTWDISKGSRTKQDIVFHDHSRTVNKVTFHPTEPYMLLSGSQDGNMKNFDLRTSGAVCTYYTNGDSVRDVQFNPHQPYMFASAHETGNVLIWDLRRSDKYDRQFTSHTGPVFAVDWHPDEKRWLATAGRDKTIKVWDTSPKQPHLDCTIATVASVARIKWRPQRKYHIASTSLVVDFSVNIWDLRRPYIPFAAFIEHKDVSTGIVWRHSPHVFLSTSKDSTIYQHAFKDADRPADRANPMGLDIDCVGHIALASSNRILDESTTAKQNSKTIPAFFRRAPTLGELFPSSISSCLFFKDSSESILSLDWLVASAKRYLLTGKPFEEICDHNSTVAMELNRPAEAHTWKFIKLLYGTSSTIPPAPNIPAKNLFPEVVQSDPSKDIAPGPSTTVPTKGTDPHSNDKEKARHSHSVQRALMHHKGSNRRLTNSGRTSIGLTDEDTEMDDTDQGTITDIASVLASSTQKQFWEGGIGYDPQLFCNWDEPPEEIDESEKWKLPREAFTPHHELTMTHTPPPEQLCLAAFSPRNLPHAHVANSPPVSSDTEDYDPIMIKPEALDIPLWDCTPIVQNMLNHYAEQGDVQMCVAVLLILGNRLKEGVIDELVQEQWYTSYIELLTRFQMWSEANEVIKLSPLPCVNTMNQHSTTMHTNCNRCSRQLQFNGWLCERCKKNTNTCSVCHRIVKGLYVWCQGCSHGGHLQHMKEWMQVNPYCPTGCGHLCEYA